MKLLPLIPTIQIRAQILAPIVQLSTSLLRCWSFKISHNLESLRKTQTFFTNQLDHVSDSPQAVSNVIDQMCNLYSNDPILNLQLIATWWKMMILWRITPLIQIFPQFEFQSVFQSYFTFSQVFSTLQWTSTLLFKEKIELSKFRQNLTYVYRYKWWFVSIQTLWPAFKLKDLTYVSIQTRMCIDTYISFLKSWLICIKSCKHDSIHHALSDFLREVSVYRYMQAWFDTQVTLCLWEITFVSIQVIDVSIQIAQNQSEVISGHLYRYTCLCIDT